MEKISLLSSLVVVFSLVVIVSAQSPKTSLDNFLEDSETIVVAKCVRAGPVDILLRSRVEMQVLLVFKGDPKISSLSLNLRYGMRPESRYLVRIPKPSGNNPDLSFNDDLETIIPVWAGEELDELKALSPRIVVLRTANLRIDDLESLIRRGNSELDPLKTLRKGN